MKVFEEFYEKGVLSGMVNETYICLILIKKESSRFRDFRPISLVSSIYKIVAKVLALMLQAVLEKSILNHQFTFVGGRQLLDVVFVANEIIGECRKKEVEGVGS